MNGFNPKSAVKIMGFNGSISRSAGRGDIEEFAYSRDGGEFLSAFRKFIRY
jgi:hypothetical protein